ncbi:MAG TPA: HlyD family efflux transporter periplasmic adaptor subunit [Candidatus Limnocylindrales bacterium]|nr:HlyD family efflux transporter periplasmic adaptor subunit [Candidatus Limnocylindrales bacterium]
MKLKVATVIVLLAIGVGTAGWVVLAPGGNGAAASQYLTAAVTRTTVADQVVATGSARSAVTYDLAFGSEPVLSGGATAGGAASWLVEDVRVGVGDRVATGDVLATADTASAEAAVEVARASLAVAEARLAVDKGGLTSAERAAAYDSIRQAQQQLAVAKQSRKDTVAQNDLKLEQARGALARVQQQLVDDQTAGPESATIDADQAAITQAQQALDTLNLQIAGATTDASLADQQNQLKLSQAQTTLSTAESALAVCQATGSTPTVDPSAEPTTAPTPRDCTSAAQAVTQAQQAIDTLNLQIQTAAAQASTTSQQNQLKLSQAQAALATAQQKLADDQVAGPADATIKADQAAIDQAQEQLDTLELSLASSNSSAANQLASAQLSLSSSQHNYANQTAPADDSTIATDEASVTTARINLEDAEHTLDGAELVSPLDGVVVAVNMVAGTIAPASADITVASLDMEVTATVTETDLPSLAVGQTVSVEITATGETATGIVKQISPVADSADTGGVVSYPIVVALDNPPAGTASGMTAEVQVTTAEAANVLAVPAEAINGSDGNYSVMVLGADGQPAAQPVEVGLITSDLAEISSGLNEGDTVVTGISRAQTGTATTTGGGLGGGLGGGAFPVGGGSGPVIRQEFGR